MSRKHKPVVDVQFDENGNPVEVHEEPKVLANRITDEERYAIEIVAKFASHDGSFQADYGTWGIVPFTTAQIQKYATRFDVCDETRKISNTLRKLVKDGTLFKPTSKTYQYDASIDQQKDDFKALMEVLRPGRFPTK